MLLDQPPNSSSAVTLGAGLKPPVAPGTIGVLAKALLELPHPKSLPDGTLESSGLLCAGAGGGLVGAGVAHSFPPQTSAPDIPVPNPTVAALTPELLDGSGAAGFGCGDDRLKTESDCAGAGAGCGAGGGDVCVTGADRSKRSPIADAAGLVCGGGEDGEVKEPNPLPAEGRFWWLEAGCCAGGCEGLASKKLPPLSPPNALVLDACGVPRLLDEFPRLAKGSAGAGFGLVGFERLRLLNASLKPPAEACDCCGDPMPPKALFC